MKTKLSRRSFLGGAVVTTSHALLGAAGPQKAASAPSAGVQPPEDAVRRFAGALEGTVIRPDAPTYDSDRRVWNGAIDRRPLLIAKCAVPEDVIRSVEFAQHHNILLSVRGGGHHAAGLAVADGGLMVDLSGMKDVRLRDDRTVLVGPGVTAGQLHRTTQELGLMLPTGTVSTVGVGGLALGGGEGWLTPRHGLTCDNLLSADLVNREGALLHVSPEEHGDLFWAIRGGGGNFGVLTSFEFRVHEAGKEIEKGTDWYSR